MPKTLKNHKEWIKYQFENYLRKEYRNIFIHSSIIEGVLVSESNMNTFDSANKFLLCFGHIKSPEFCVFNKIREIRNKIAHEIFKNKLDEKNINQLRDNLMWKIHEAYKISRFLNDKLFKRYVITRPTSIKFNPV